MENDNFNMFTEIEKDNLADSIKTDFFDISKKDKQNLLKYNIEKKEIIYLIPKKPLLSPGQLLGCKNILDNDEENYFAKINSGELSEGDLEISTPNVVYATNFFTSKKVMETTLMVVGERIEIYKVSRHKIGKTDFSELKKTSVNYIVSHYIDVIDGASKKVIQTNMFENTSMVFGTNYTTEKLDIEFIKYTYSNANIEKIISPLQILSTAVK